MDEKLKVCFDKEYKIRVLDPVKSERTEDLQSECTNFGESMYCIKCYCYYYCCCYPNCFYLYILHFIEISSFSEKISSLVQILEVHANRIDTQKLRVCI